MMWKKVIGYILLVAIVLIAGCQATAPQTNVETYSNTRFGFSVNYPEGWEVTEEDLEIAYLIDFDCKPATVAIQIFSSPVIKWTTLADYYEVIRDDLLYPEGYREILEEHSITVDKLPAKELTFSWPTDDGLWKGTIIVFLGNYPYTIAYVVPADSYADYHQDFRLIVGTFRFTD